MLPIVNAPAVNGNPPTNGKPIPPGVQNRIGTIYQNVANQRQAN
jgi:hypothetical protein